MQPFPFFVGCGRSGTTLVRAMFDSHPEMAIPHESHFIVPLARGRSRYERPEGFATETFVADLVQHPWFSRWGLAEDEVRESLRSNPPADCPEAIRRLFTLYARRRSKPRYADKTPGYVNHLSLLAAFLPEARFVHVIRDGREVALSLLEMEWGPTSFRDAAFYWKERVERGRRTGGRLGSERYREVRYEELVRDPEARLRELCAFVGVPFDSTMLRYHDRAEDVVTAAEFPHRHRRLFLPPTEGLRDWRRQMSLEELARFEAVAGGLLSELGYERGLDSLPVWTVVGAALHRLKRSAVGRARALAGYGRRPARNRL
jgi:hypothetical protein